MNEEMKIDSTVIKALCYHIIDIIEFYELMERTHDCNDCGNIDNCGIAPDYGEQVRYNCYLWKEKKRGVE